MTIPVDVAWAGLDYAFGAFGFEALNLFLTTLVTIFQLANLPTNLVVDTPDLLAEYDYVIVGAGSAGCVLANRLSEDPSRKVLLLEAGGTEGAFSQVPLFAPLLIGGKLDWQYKTEPQEQACLAMENQTCPWARGLTMGGSSAINFMLFVRGNRRDYDIWQNEFGAYGWSYQDVLPHFKNIETSHLSDQDQTYRGTSGETPVEHANTQTRLSEVLLEACQELGYPIVDYNGASQAGCSRLEANLANGVRSSASKSFIVPILGRRNLDISLFSHVTKVLFEGKRAVGVTFLKNGQTRTVRASREVILSAGAVGSPQLLLLSGIGPKADLKKLQIPVIADLPVGHNLQDHMHVDGIAATMTGPFGIDLVQLSTLTDYKYWRSGPLSIPGSIEVLAFVSTRYVDESLQFPDAEIALQSISSSATPTQKFLKNMGLREDVYNQYYLPNRARPGFALAPVMNRPKSRGYIKLRSKDPLQRPIIDPNYLSHPHDVAAAVDAAKIAVRLIRSSAMKAVGAELWDIPLAQCASQGPMWSDAYLTCLVRHLAHTTWHACCTCPMGSDSRSVLDHRLRVRGVAGLRVVDASVMPTIVTGNLNVPTMMIGDKAGSMIIEDNQ